jgi:maltooligosyltrehalose trehalohydrolase
MLFMGEEGGASTPWMFFTSFPDPELAAAVREGRRAEFGEHGWSADDVPDPQDPMTFERSRLDWAELDKESHRELFDWHRQLIRLRRSRTELTDGRLDRVSCFVDEAARALVLRRGSLAVACNLAAERRSVALDGAPTGVLLASEPGFVYRDGEVELAGESVAIVTMRP